MLTQSAVGPAASKLKPSIQQELPRVSAALRDYFPDLQSLCRQAEKSKLQGAEKSKCTKLQGAAAVTNKTQVAVHSATNKTQVAVHSTTFIHSIESDMELEDIISDYQYTWSEDYLIVDNSAAKQSPKTAACEGNVEIRLQDSRFSSKRWASIHSNHLYIYKSSTDKTLVYKLKLDSHAKIQTSRKTNNGISIYRFDQSLGTPTFLTFTLSDTRVRDCWMDSLTKAKSNYRGI